MKLAESLNPQKALIWRIVHRDNIPWILDNGLHCGNSKLRSESWINIGSSELINKRAQHPVSNIPGRTLGDYVPFYFTPFTPMMLNIKTGRSGVQNRAPDELVILVSSVHHLASLKIPFIFTDGHAYSMLTKFYDDVTRLDKIDWEILQKRDFKRSEIDPAKLDRYQAEALVYKHLPLEGLHGMICHTDAVKQKMDAEIQARNISLKTAVGPNWYL